MSNINSNESNRKVKNPKLTYEEQEQELESRSSDNWFQFYRPYTRIMKKLTSMFFQDLINIAKSKGMRRKKIGGDLYFQCTEGFLVNSEIGWSKKEQETLIGELVVRKFLIRKKIGLPGTRWLSIQWHNIKEALKDPIRYGIDVKKSRDNKFPPKRDDCIPPKRDDNKEEEDKKEKGDADSASVPPVSKPSLNGQSPLHVPRNPLQKKKEDSSPVNRHVSAAKRLKSASSVGRYVPFPSIPVSAEALRKLEKTVGESYLPRLDWYCDHCSPKDRKLWGVPVVKNGVQFAQQYDWIGNAMDRWRKGQKANSDEYHEATGHFQGTTEERRDGKVIRTRRGVPL